MPELAKITNTFFIDLINRLGIRPPFGTGFEISNVVTPVSIVDANVAFSAVSTSQLLDTPFTAGELLAPAANTVLADTGAQNAGTYQSFIIWSGDSAASGGSNLRIQRRDSANAANIWSQTTSIPAQVGGSPLNTLAIRFVLSQNERLRVITGPAATVAGLTVQANIWLVAST